MIKGPGQSHWMDWLGDKLRIGGDTVELLAWAAVLFGSLAFIVYCAVTT